MSPARTPRGAPGMFSSEGGYKGCTQLTGFPAMLHILPFQLIIIPCMSAHSAQEFILA